MVLYRLMIIRFNKSNFYSFIFFQDNFISMYNNFQSPSYYRSNPFSNEGYMPPMAHKNRKHKEFFSQIPQGQQYLDPTTKKHFKGKAYESEIQHSGIFSTPQKYPHQNELARDRGYFRSLNTLDIQGAKPNTIVSMGVKNKLKAQQQLRRRQRQKNQPINNQHKMQPQGYWMSQYRNEDQKRRQYILSQLKKGSLPNNQNPTFVSRVNYHNRQQKKETMEKEVLQQIKYQQNQVRQPIFNKHDKPLQGRDNYQQIQQKKYPQQQLQNQTIQHQQYDRIQPITNNPQQYQNYDYGYYRNQHIPKQELTGRSHSLNNMQPVAKRGQYQDNKNVIQYKNAKNRQNLKTQLQRDIVQKQQHNYQQNHQKSYPTKFQQIQRSYNPPYQHVPFDKYAQPKYHPHPSDQSLDLFNYYSKNQNAQKQQKKIDISQYEYGKNQYPQNNHQNYGSREDHRKNNPTNLSYGSPSFSLAGKNVVGY